MDVPRRPLRGKVLIFVEPELGAAFLGAAERLVGIAREPYVNRLPESMRCSRLMLRYRLVAGRDDKRLAEALLLAHREEVGLRLRHRHAGLQAPVEPRLVTPAI